MKILKLLKFAVLVSLLSLLIPATVKADDALNHWYYRNSTPLNKVRFVGGLFFGLGTNGTLLTSPDGSNWTTQVTGTTDTLTGAAYIITLLPYPPHIYVVVGSSGTILTSMNAVNWSMTNLGVGLADIASDNGDLVAATVYRQTATQPNFFYSYEGGHWTSSTLSGGETEGVLLPYEGYYCPAICFDSYDGIFVTAAGFADSDYDIWTSDAPDVVNWTNAAVTGASATGVASGNGTNIVVGWEASPLESTDGGYTWFTVAHGGPILDTDITYGNGTFLVATAYGGFYVATNSLGWQQRTLTMPLNIQSVAYGNGTFVGVSSGYYSSFNTNRPGIYQSLPVSIPIITSTPATNTNALNLVISGQISQEYRLQTSSNFSQWTDLWKYTNTNPTVEYIAPINSNAPKQFFRVVSP